MIADYVVYCLRGRAPDSTGFRQSQAGKGYLRFPDIDLDGGDLGFEVVDDHSQLVIAWREVGREVEEGHGIDRFARGPVAGRPVVRVPEDAVLLEGSFACGIVEAQGDGVVRIQAGFGVSLQNAPERAFLSCVEALSV